jgi:peptidoglycan/LPS O-acetylase OafA/YrhL
MKYRSDIDGLRAIAVLLVILFHAKTGLFTGGYIGVDIFFAISGFLITSIIYTKILSGDFSFIDFYKRRAKRLLPASLFMTLVTLFVFAAIYPPDVFKILSESAIASVLFSSNFYFWQTSGYFSPNVEIQPLLHTWSLSVEEQFYFLFPLALFSLLMLKLSTRTLLSLIGVSCAISLALAVIYAPSSLSFIGFYVLPTRFYEMGLGALLAIYLINRPDAFQGYKYLREIGLLGILVAAYCYNKNLAFPSYYALLPVIGALMVIIDPRKEGLTYRLLCYKLVVFIGILSYSLYLWHWPIWVVFQWLFDEQTLLLLVLYFVSTFVVSYLSYILIENPMRHFSWYRSGLNISISASFSVFFIASLGYFTLYSNNQVLPVSVSVLNSYNKSLLREPYRDECTDSKRLKGNFSICNLRSQSNAKYSILLWGDSHGSAMMSALNLFSEEFNIDAINTSGCPSLLYIKRRNDLDCHLHNDYVKSYLTGNPEKYDLILNVSAWNNYIESNLLERGSSSSLSEMTIGIKNTLEFYKNIEVNHAFVSQIPKYEASVPLSFFRFHLGLANKQSAIAKKTFDDKQSQFIAMFPKGSNIISLESFFCSKLMCQGTNKDIILYKDAHHISVAAAELTSKSLENTIKNFIDKNHNISTTL